MKYFVIKLLLSSLAFFPMIYSQLAYAHTGIDTQNGWVYGFIHPIGGLDHVLTMIAVGLWAAQMGGRAIWLVPFTFVAVMTLGGVAGIIAVPFGYTEVGIIISLLVFGMLIAASIRLPLTVSAMIVGIFAFCHGYAHGAEMSQHISGLTYALGFVSATALLHALGIGIGIFIKHKGSVKWLQLAGMGVILYGSSMVLIG
ncbi:HupE/UreJ family protein [Nitrosomonas sp. Nm34]|uniref:HupE/UreJ family protein n=1 Tax=Nitrosomonas sp. Nm34 TaxID=1881055 RepID=UPI0008E8E4A9|nr:HupE/UreJ family protein [Nitrosomonas sp. Nm34]SFI49009.1 urease accessory protein [Nitrosomonas sp. Nm34]